jgi:hypothetical protein
MIITDATKLASLKESIAWAFAKAAVREVDPLAMEAVMAEKADALAAIDAMASERDLLLDILTAGLHDALPRGGHA